MSRQPPPSFPQPFTQPFRHSLPPHALSGDIAAIKWADSPSPNDEHIRIYYQRSDGYIYEGAWNGNGWDSGDTKIVKAKLGTPITAFAFPTWSPVAIRLYYMDDRNRITELCWNGQSWLMELALPSPSVAADTRLACYGWDDGNGPYIKIYYQKSDAVLSTISYSLSRSWVGGEGGLLWGHEASSMSANRLGGDIHVYCQGDDTSLIKVSPRSYGNSVDLMKSFRIPGGAGISAVSWDRHQRVYFVGDYGSIHEMRNDGEGWITPPSQPTNARTGRQAKLAAVLRSTNPERISVYFLESGQDQVTEMAYDGYRWGLSKLPF